MTGACRQLSREPVQSGRRRSSLNWWMLKAPLGSISPEDTPSLIGLKHKVEPQQRRASHPQPRANDFPYLPEMTFCCWISSILPPAGSDWDKLLQRGPSVPSKRHLDVWCLVLKREPLSLSYWCYTTRFLGIRVFWALRHLELQFAGGHDTQYSFGEVIIKTYKEIYSVKVLQSNQMWGLSLSFFHK